MAELSFLGRIDTSQEACSSPCDAAEWTSKFQLLVGHLATTHMYNTNCIDLQLHSEHRPISVHPTCMHTCCPLEATKNLMKNAYADLIAGVINLCRRQPQAKLMGNIVALLLLLHFLSIHGPDISLALWLDLHSASTPVTYSSPAYKAGDDWCPHYHPLKLPDKDQRNQPKHTPCPSQSAHPFLGLVSP